MLSMLIAYDADGNVVATLDYLVAKDDAGNVIGLVDFGAHEAAGERLRDVWQSSRAVGSATWPEWIGSRAHDFKVELDANPDPSRARLTALVHKASGHRRERAAVEAEIASRMSLAAGRPADIRDLVGGPNRPLLLDDAGRNLARVPRSRPSLPVVSRRPTEKRNGR